MNKKQQIISKAEELLKVKEKTIRNKNAIEQLIGMCNLDKLYNIFFGVSDKLEIEKYKLTLNEVLDFLVEIDNKINGAEILSKDKTICILLENISSNGNVVGFEGNTSNNQVKEMFINNSMDIKLKNIRANGNITGMKLNVDNEAELKKPLKISSDFGKVEFNPSANVKIIFGSNN